jgi:hypothetical protein
MATPNALLASPTPNVVTTSGPSLAERLYAALLPGKPRLASRMTGQAEPKYMDIRGEYRFDVAMFRDHLNGRETYAVSLALAGYARAGCRDYDNASKTEMLAALRKAAEHGLCAFLILMPDNRAHLWCIFADDVPVSDIRAALRKLPGGKGELYPSGSRIRLPFGYHKLKQTRGTLVLPNGERFDLDNPAQMRQAIDAVLNLPRNPAPEPASEAEQRSDAAWGDAYKPEHWQDLPEGLPIWQSPRVERLSRLSFRAQLGQLLRGERVTLLQNGAPDDSDSAQVACLVFHLMGASFPEAEVRAVALALKDTLRPGRGLDHYRAHVDAEIERYRPKSYQPQATIAAGQMLNTKPAEPAPLPPAQHRTPRARKDRPQKVAGALGYFQWLQSQVDPQSGSVMLSAQQCADRLGCTLRTVKRYEAELRALGAIERQAFNRRQSGCLFLLRDVVTTSRGNVVTGEADPPHQNAECANDAAHRVNTPGGGTAPPSGELPRRPLRELVAEGLAVYAEAPARGKRSRAALVREHVATNGGAHYPAEAVVEHYRIERERERIGAIRTLNGLKAYLRTVEHRAERAAAEASHSAAWWRFVARLVAEEMRCRPPEAPKERRSPRKQCEALPNLRALGEQRQLEILRDAARELSDWRHERRPAGPGPGVFTQPTQIAPPAPVEGTPAHLFAALRAKQAPAAAAD